MSEPIFEFIDDHKQLIMKDHAFSSSFRVNQMGPPPLSKQLRGKYVHRHKSKARRRHSMAAANKEVVVGTVLLTNVFPLSIPIVKKDLDNSLDVEVTFMAIGNGPREKA